MTNRNKPASSAFKLFIRVVPLLLLGLPLLAGAQGIPAITSTPAPGGGQNYSLSLQTLLLLTSLSMLPAAGGKNQDDNQHHP